MTIVTKTICILGSNIKSHRDQIARTETRISLIRTCMEQNLGSSCQDSSSRSNMQPISKLIIITYIFTSALLIQYIKSFNLFLFIFISFSEWWKLGEIWESYHVSFILWHRWLQFSYLQFSSGSHQCARNTRNNSIQLLPCYLTTINKI